MIRAIAVPRVFYTPAFRYGLTIVVLLDIALLTALRASGADDAVSRPGQALLIIAFAGLSIVDFRAAVAIVVLELACAGASGHWTVYSTGVSGRLVLDIIVLFRAIAELALRARDRNLRPGRYTLHALAIAIVLPLDWMALGWANENRLADIFGDGNGYAFFAFVLVIAALAQLGDLAWLRRWLLIACIVNAIVTFFLAAAALTGFAPLDPTLREILLVRLDMGGVFQTMPGGLPRLFLGSGLYLQVGVAILTWEMLRRPRNIVPYLLMALFVVDLALTWTRGYWSGAAIAFMFVLVFGSRSVRRTVQVASVAVLAVAIAIVVLLFVGSTLPYEFLDRAAGIIGLGNDAEGAGSTATKVVQAQVLLAHISERPLIGWGFGTIARDYPFGQIYTYELGYLDLAYKTGLIGLLIFLSLPVRLLIDSVRACLDRVQLPIGVPRGEASVAGAIVLSILVAGASNPYFLAAFGLAPIILAIAWLDPFGRPSEENVTSA